MKKEIYIIITVLFMIIFSSCRNEEFDNKQAYVHDNKAEITLRFKAELANFKQPKTRSNDIETNVTNLNLLLFNEQGVFIKNCVAELTDGNTFKVTLPKSNKKRIIHYVSNIVIADTEMKGKSENEVIPQLQTDNMSMWHRQELASGISESTQLDNGSQLLLLRNKIKVTVKNEAASFILDSWRFHLVPDQGTVAPFNPSGNNFDVGTITEAPMQLIDGTVKAKDESDYIFEAELSSFKKPERSIIIKGQYEGVEQYYRIVLIDNQQYDINLQRNYHYIITIKDVMRTGKSNEAETILAAADNNVIFDTSIDQYPMISNGKEKIEVDKVFHIFTDNGGVLNAKVLYTPNISATPAVIDNSGMLVELEQDENKKVINGQISFDAATGKLTANIADISTTGEIHEARIYLSKGSLSRVIIVRLKAPYKFGDLKMNGSTSPQLAKAQKTEAKLSFIIPEMDDQMFPFICRIYTQHLSPKQDELRLRIDKTNLSEVKIYYEYIVETSGSHEVLMQRNTRHYVETVELVTDYFETGKIAYTSE